MNELQSAMTFDPAALLERIGADPEFLQELTLIFAEDSTKLVESIRQAVAAGDHAALAHAAHSLKGSALNFGATAVSNLCLELEQLGRSGRTAVPEHKIASLGAELCRLNEQLQKYSETVQRPR